METVRNPELPLMCGRPSVPLPYAYGAEYTADDVVMAEGSTDELVDNVVVVVGLASSDEIIFLLCETAEDDVVDVSGAIAEEEVVRSSGATIAAGAVGLKSGFSIVGVAVTVTVL